MEARLETLIAFSETKSYTRAAQMLGITQPAVSGHIKQLEKEYGCSFVHRTELGMQLTPQGEIAVRYAKQIQQLYRSLSERMEEYRRSAGGIAVGLTHSAQSHIMAQVLARCCVDRKDISFTVHTASGQSLWQKLCAGEFDLAVAEGEVPQDLELDSVVLETDRLMLAVPPTHALAGKESVSCAELMKENLLLRLPDSSTRSLFLNELEAQGMSLSDFHVTMQVDSITAIKDLIIQGYGVSVLASSACQREVQAGKLCLLPIRSMNMNREIRLVFRRDFRQTDILELLIQTYDTIVSQHD